MKNAPRIHIVNGRMNIHQDGADIPVTVTPCFPWREPESFLSLRDDDGDEKALVRSLDDLDSASRQTLLRELREHGRTFTVTAVNAMNKEIELRCWEVDTEQGPRSFQTELDEWPRQLQDGSLLIEDLYGDLYRIPDPQTLPPASRTLIQPLVD